jgi:hypothetical protein
MLSLLGLALSLGVAVGVSPAASAAAPSTPDTITCESVTQYRVTEFGNLTDAYGNVIGYGYANDIFNVRSTGYPRYYGAIARTGQFGYFLSSKLAYIGPACV